MAHRVAVLWRKAIRTLGMVGTVARWPHRLGREKRMVASIGGLATNCSSSPAR
ncbi:MAG: hypothetical protein VX190_03560 [Bacteroidota bacterium]|nr:hypothetical protein [Flavobacteriales bacterium]MEC7950415.1 hypothetical protein [Bacteroidota bacterium]MED5318105.1 hypothetical protein [Bacteroidota bacterium]